MKVKYFNLSKPLKILEFEEFENPMGWFRLNKFNIELKANVLTVKEIFKLEKERFEK